MTENLISGHDISWHAVSCHKIACHVAYPAAASVRGRGQLLLPMRHRLAVV